MVHALVRTYRCHIEVITAWCFFFYAVTCVSSCDNHVTTAQEVKMDELNTLKWTDCPPTANDQAGRFWQHLYTTYPNVLTLTLSPEKKSTTLGFKPTSPDPTSVALPVTPHQCFTVFRLSLIYRWGSRGRKLTVGILSSGSCVHIWPIWSYELEDVLRNMYLSLLVLHTHFGIHRVKIQLVLFLLLLFCSC